MNVKPDNPISTNTDPNGNPQGSLFPFMVGAHDASRLLGISRTTLYSMHSTGQLGPSPHKYGRRRLWAVAELQAWIKAGSPARPIWNKKKGQAR